MTLLCCRACRDGLHHRWCVLRDAARGPLLRMRGELLMASQKSPHPEEAAKRLSRRTHGARPSKAVPRDLLDPVIDHFKPQRVILFGSRARGEATRDSDIDLLVIVDDNTPPEKLSWRAGYEAHRSRYAADVVPMRADTFERNRNIVGTLAAEADV